MGGGKYRKHDIFKKMFAYPAVLIYNEMARIFEGAEKSASMTISVIVEEAVICLSIKRAVTADPLKRTARMSYIKRAAQKGESPVHIISAS